MIKKILILLALIIPLMLPLKSYSASCWTFPYEQGFESGTPGEPFSDAACPTGGFIWSTSTKTNVSHNVENTYTAREGDNYLDLKSTWVDCDGAFDSSRVGGLFHGFGDSCPSYCYFFEPGESYWIGFSFYFPADYMQQYFDNQILQVKQSGPSGDDIVFSINTGGGMTPYESNGYFRFVIDYNDSGTSGSYVYNLTSDWTEYRGEWIDIVLHFVWSSTGTGVTEIWADGNLIVSYSGPNMPEADNDLYFNPDCYNWALTGTPCSTWVYQYDTPGWTRNSIYDAWRWDIGADKFCVVAPAIWPQVSTTSYPGNGATGIDTAYTMTYSGYADHRVDEQGCFAYSVTEIQINEDGDGDWTTSPIHSGTVGAETSHAITGLAYNTLYRERHRHLSIRSGTADTYTDVTGSDGWSDTVTFTTKAGEASPPMAILNINSGGLTIDNINSGGLAVELK